MLESVSQQFNGTLQSFEKHIREDLYEIRRDLERTSQRNFVTTVSVLGGMLAIFSVVITLTHYLV